MLARKARKVSRVFRGLIVVMAIVKRCVAVVADVGAFIGERKDDAFPDPATASFGVIRAALRAGVCGVARAGVCARGRIYARRQLDRRMCGRLRYWIWCVGRRFFECLQIDRSAGGEDIGLAVVVMPVRFFRRQRRECAVKIVATVAQQFADAEHSQRKGNGFVSAAHARASAGGANRHALYSSM